MDMIGIEFGRLRVVSFAFLKNQRRHWHCVCSCGGKKILSTARITGARPTLSCGCLHREITRNAKRTHGQAFTSTYKVWTGMIQRCTNPKNPAFGNYGGRGISVCTEWLSFDGFFASMGEKPINRSLDRIDNNSGYSEDNCRWATRSEQARNRRSSKMVTIGEETKALAEWIESAPVTASCVERRLMMGMDAARAVTMESQNKHHKKRK